MNRGDDMSGRDFDLQLERLGGALRTASDPGAAFAQRVLRRTRHAAPASGFGTLTPAFALKFSLACTLVLAAAFAAGWTLLQTAPGSVTSRMGRVEISGIIGSLNALRTGSQVRTGSNSSSLIDLADGGMRVYLGEGSEVSLSGPRSLDVHNASAWITVTAGHEPVEVHTAAGRLVARSGSFALVAQDGVTRVYVADGSVSLVRGGDRLEVREREFIEWRVGGSRPSVVSTTGKLPPEWAERVNRDYRMTRSPLYAPTYLSI